MQGIETFTPRLLAVDCQGSLGSLVQDGELYQDDLSGKDPLTTSSWDGAATTTIHQLPYARNEFLQGLHDQDLAMATQQMEQVNCHSELCVLQ